MKQKGICILVESPDGAGKDTLIENIKNNYKDKHFKVYKFPSGKFREMIFEKPRTQMELVPLFCQDFKESIEQIKQDIANGENIIINRMYISTILYSLENDTPDSIVYYNIDSAIGKWRPDLTVLIDIDATEAFKRLQSRNDEKNWLDGNFDKQIRINQLYKDFFKENWKKLYKTRDNIIQVNGNGSREEVFNNFDSQFKKWQSRKLMK